MGPLGRSHLMVGVGLPGAGAHGGQGESTRERGPGHSALPWQRLCPAPPRPAPPLAGGADSQALGDALQGQRLPLQGHQVGAGVSGEEQARLPVHHAVGCEDTELTAARLTLPSAHDAPGPGELDTPASPQGCTSLLALTTRGGVWAKLSWRNAGVA